MNITDLTVPGVWRCPKCRFTQVNQTLAPDGIGADTRPHLWPCPNDGRDMVPVTWREHAADLEKMLIQRLDAETLLQSLFNASAELRFTICAGTRAIQTNASWLRHTEVMKQVEEALKKQPS
jgi:hypothetical protein